MNPCIKIHTESCVAFEVIQKLKVNSRVINFNCRNIKTNLYVRDDLVHRRGSNEHVLVLRTNVEVKEKYRRTVESVLHTHSICCTLFEWKKNRSLRQILHIECINKTHILVEVSFHNSLCRQ